ncbi:hypothetical protein [Rhodococcus opacus]|uniref:hypothetical protein n=1 Tax=Rhodococcus opacus TaxID=37919 RepID=UPI00211EB48E|nr:hypothetical protein [Rhodococcus opacus]
MTASNLTAAASDVVWAAYAAAVRIPEHAVPVDRVAGCARCGLVTTVMTPVGQVISRRFTGLEHWTNLAGRHLCQVCVWVYRHRPLRTHAHVVTRRPGALTQGNRQLLRQVLSAPVSSDVAVIVPLRPGRKHLLPAAQWGHVTTDDSHLTWSESDAARLTVMSRLRRLGFTETMLSDEAPRYAILHRVPADQWAMVFDDWERLDAWRHADPWWQVRIHASRM